MRIFKLFRDDEWQALQQHGRTAGAPVDLADGFIHFSTAAQLRETAAKWFQGEQEVWLVTCDGDRLGGALRWEPARRGALFPHLYRDLTLADVAAASRLTRDAAGFRFPPDIP